MEHIIAKLLTDFEDGRMTRRQLIRSLALAVAAAPAATASAASPWKTVKLDHISYAVADYKKSAAFYSDLMGWQVRNDNGTTQATLQMGDIGEIIIRNRREPAEIGVINHISWGIQPWETDTVEAELERRGLTPRPDMVGDDFKSFHVKDPDGWDLQISNQAK
jgi:catechol 2,3-dioxygenase-like lactoylglutathione lyase family enzyme